MPSLRALIVFFLLVLMEVLAGFAVIIGTSLLDLASLSFSAFWLLLVAALAGLGIGLTIALLAPGEPWNRLSILGGGVLAAALPAYLVTKSPLSFVVTIFLLALFYWRGLASSQNPPDLAEVQGRFGIGFGVLFLGILWVMARGVIYQRPIWYILAILGIAYTLTAMVALVVARLSTRREPGAGKAVLLAVALQLGLLLLLALAALQIFALDIAGSAWDEIRPVFDATGSTVYRFVLLLAGPIQWLATLGHPHHARHASSPSPLTRLGRGANPKIKHRSPVGGPWILIIGLTVAGMVLSAIGYLIWLMLPHIPRYSRDRGYSEERQPLVTPLELWQAFLQWLRSLVRRTAETAGRVTRKTRRRLFGDYPADPVRRMYAQLLRRAAAAGFPRDPGATPVEYRTGLQQRWPDVAFDLATLTDAYVLRRYGDTLADEHELDRLNHHWHRIRTAIRVPRIPLPSSVLLAGQTPRQNTPHRLAALIRLAPQRLKPWFSDPESGLVRTLIVFAACLLTPLALYVTFLILIALGSR